MSLVDAALLQRREGYFTGGFLSTDHLQNGWDVARFVAVSLLTDAAVVGMVAALAFWLARGLRPRAAAACAFLAGTVPLLVADVIAYELVSYLGDALDLRLMFELTGDSLNEIWAVSSAHLAGPLALVATGLTACGGLVWLVNRRQSGSVSGRPRVAVLLVPVCLFLVALAAATVASAANERLQNGLLRKPAGKVVTAIADELTDVDRDGFGVGGRMLDPDPRDARVFPYAVDRPGNEVDEDGLAGDLPAGTAAYAESRVPAPWRRHPDVVFVVLESFRFDLVGSRFGGRPVTPVLDALAARGVASRAAYSHNGYTAQSRFHFMSGSLAGVSDGTTLIDDFRANGYTTVYVSGQDESFGGARYQVGFDRADVAFDARAARDRRYSTFATAGSLAVPLAVVDEHVADALAHRVPADKPLFLYVNFHDTHFPYTHDGITTVTSDVRVPRGGIIPDARPQIWATYANTAANVDRAVGQVLERVRAARGREAAVVVTADHGESLFDGDFLGHGHALDDVQTRVPLIAVDLPLVIAEPFGHVDLRDAIGAALSIPAAEPSAPRLDASSGREVFQYLGHINRPRQIALRSVDGGITYDFRRRQVRRPGREWVRPANLSPADRRDFERLVHEWERMMLARETRGLHG